MLDEAELGSSRNLGKYPLSAQNTFHSQFQLQEGKYRDNNNYLKHNQVITKDDRFWPMGKP